jgi:hypothetical protein
VYDGTANINDLTLSSTSVQNGDVVSATASMASFDNAHKNVGTNLNLTFSGLVLTGADANNYALASNTVTSTGSITAKTLSLSGTTVAGKAYDGNTNATILTQGTLSGFVGNETLLLSNVTGAFASAAVGINKAVSIAADLQNGTNGGLATNYTLDTSTAYANIAAVNTPNNNPVRPVVPRPPLVPTQQNSGNSGSGNGGGASSNGNPYIALPKGPNSVENCTPSNLERCTCEAQGNDGIAICYAPAKTASNQQPKQTKNVKTNRA